MISQDALTIFVRGWESDIPDLWRNWFGIRFCGIGSLRRIFDEVAQGQRRWPSARRSKSQSGLVRLLAYLLKTDVETPWGGTWSIACSIAAWQQVVHADDGWQWLHSSAFRTWPSRQYPRHGSA